MQNQDETCFRSTLQFRQKCKSAEDTRTKCFVSFLHYQLLKGYLQVTHLSVHIASFAAFDVTS